MTDESQNKAKKALKEEEQTLNIEIAIKKEEWKKKNKKKANITM